ncbi:EamA family transporter [Candidatus Micrarchaeota archaeon]|nr:EamA family transporter [Candidatus Micrarchaeota archaeon]
MAENWVILALGAVVLLGVANVLLKLVAVKAQDSNLPVHDLVAWLPVIVLVVLALAALVVWVLKPSSDLLVLSVFWILASVVAVAFIFLALQKGSASVVTALLALSAVVVAVISFVFFGERLSAQQLVGIALCLVAVAAFAL